LQQYEAMASQALEKGKRPAAALLKGSIEEAADRGFVQRGALASDGFYYDEYGNRIELPPGTFFRPKRATD
jgi:hypothetical protein